MDEGQKASDEQTQNDKAALRAERLVKIYGRRRVVDEISVVVKQGEVVGLLGPNGAGKTTIFYMIVGMIQPNAGRIFLDHDEITRCAAIERAKIVGDLSEED